MNKENVGSYLWIIVTILIMLCLLAFASPFGVYIRNNLEKFTGNFIEEKSEQGAANTQSFTLKIIYNTADSGKTLETVNIKLKKGEQYNIPSPKINGYVPNIKTVEGALLDDETITVDYSRGNYSISYITNNGVFDTILLNAEGKLKTDYTSYKYGDKKNLLTAANVSRGNMQFLGWYETQDFSGSPVTEITETDFGNKVYYAKWSSNQYEIVYNMNDTKGDYYYVPKENAAGSIAAWDSVITDSDGNLKPEFTSYGYGTQLKLPTTVHKFGYTFLGWSTEPDGEKAKGNYRTQITETDSGKIVLYAHWKPNTYTITYHTDFIRPTGEKVYYQIKDTNYVVIDSKSNKTTHEGIPKNYTYGDTIVLPSTLQYHGYDITGIEDVAWYNKATVKIDITAGNEHKGTISGYPDGAIKKNTISPAIIGFVEGDKTGHDFDHSNLDLYVRPMPDIYNVVYNPNVLNPFDQPFTSPDRDKYPQEFYYDETKNLTKVKFSILGRTFLNWDSKPMGGGITFKDQQNVTNMVDIVKPDDKLNVNLYAQWRMHHYDIKYDLNRGEGTTVPQFANNGSYPTKATYDKSFVVTAPYRDGYTFTGWKIISGLDSRVAKYGDTNVPTTAIKNRNTLCYGVKTHGETYFVNLTPDDNGTVTLQAQWKPNGSDSTPECIIPECPIKYDLNEEVSTTKPAQFGKNHPEKYIFDKDILIDNPSMIGYTFTGWDITNLDTDIAHYYGDNEFYLQSNQVQPTSAKTSISSSISRTMETHFINLKKFGTVKFTANWRPNTHSITYDLNKGNGSTTPQFGKNHPTHVTFDKEFTVDNPSRLGYTFTGWTITNMSNDTIHYYGNNKTTKTETKISGIKDTTFTNLTSVDKGTVKFTAIWKANTYEIAYDLNKGNGSTTPQFGKNHPNQGGFDTTITISNPTRTGYDFTGWTITGMDTNKHVIGGKTTTVTSMNDVMDTSFLNLHANFGTIHFTANWKPIVYTITYRGNQGTWDGKSSWSEKITFDDYYTVQDNFYSRTGYTFQTWHGNGTDWTPKSNFRWMYPKDIVLDAVWKANTYKITYDLNPGSGSTTPQFGANHPTSADYDETITINNPHRTGYNFTGWTITGMDTVCTHYYGGNHTTETSINNTTASSYLNLHSYFGTVHFQAHWSPITYTITYDGNGGNWNGRNIISDNVVFDTYTILRNAGFNRVGYDINDCWNTNKNGYGTNRSYEEHFRYTTAGNTYLYATWTPHVYSISYSNCVINTMNSAPSSAKYDELITVEEPKRERDFFTYWTIAGMDNACTHYYGGNTTTSTYINNTSANKFKNLRANSGTVNFEAHWTPKHVHKYVSETTPPDCTHDGYITYTCVGSYVEFCNRPSYVVPGAPALGHDWAPATCTCPSTCRRCGLTRGSALGHDWKSATCTTAEVCRRCGLTRQAALGHNMVSNNDYRAPTCTSQGHNTSYTCSRCGYTTGGGSISALGHDWTSATCTSPSTCRRCGAIGSPALGHNMVSNNDYRAPTCTSSGHNSSSTCSRCGYTTGGGSISPLGHSSSIVQGYAPTCTQDGKTASKVCSRCGATLSAGVRRPALGHNWQYHGGKPATCTQSGYTSYKTCSRCGRTEGGVGINPLGHNMVKQAGKNPTCTHGGYGAGMYCTRCNLTTGHHPISALGHNWQRTHYQGGKYHYYCKRCGAEKWA